MAKHIVYFILIAVSFVLVKSFHLQSNPSLVARVCGGVNQNICRTIGMYCRGNQRFDADAVHAVCDFPGRRTCGIPPADVQRGVRFSWRTAFWC